MLSSCGAAEWKRTRPGSTVDAMQSYDIVLEHDCSLALLALYTSSTACEMTGGQSDMQCIR